MIVVADASSLFAKREREREGGERCGATMVLCCLPVHNAPFTWGDFLVERTSSLTTLVSSLVVYIDMMIDRVENF